MREVLALITFVLLFWIGWDQSYKDHFANVLNGRGPSSGKRVLSRDSFTIQENQSAAAPVTRDNSWMWKKSKLDNPRQPAR